MTKFKLCAVAFLSIGVLALPTAAAAQDVPTEEEIMRQYVETARGDLTAKRESALKAMIELDAGEAEVFWPIKKEYDKEARELGDAKLKLAKDYAEVHDSLTTEKAKRLADRLFELDRQRIELRRKYFERLSAEVSPVVAIQFLQVQGQFDTMGELKLATIVPIAVK